MTGFRKVFGRHDYRVIEYRLILPDGQEKVYTVYDFT